jgi:hypothetical protein
LWQELNVTETLMSTPMSAPGWSSRPSGLDPAATPLTAVHAQMGRTPLVVPPAAQPGRQPPSHVDTHATIPGAMSPYTLPNQRAIVELGRGGARTVTGMVTVNPTQRPPNMSGIEVGQAAAGSTYMADWQSGDVALVNEHAAQQPQPTPAAQASYDPEPGARRFMQRLAEAVPGPVVPGSLRAAFAAPQEQPQEYAPEAQAPMPRVQVIFDGGAEYGAWISNYVLVSLQPNMIVLVEELGDGNQSIPTEAMAAAAPDSDLGWIGMQLVEEPDTLYQVAPVIDYVFGAYQHTVLYVLKVLKR